ncbi:MAG: fused response regulator/phosphatase [Solirubrobacteraceae bacterium]
MSYQGSRSGSTVVYAPPERMNVLLIEDDLDDVVIVEDLLSDSSLDVQLSYGRTLQEGLDLLPGPIDCVLLDLRLPDVTGLEAVLRVRATAPQIAVIVLTGLDDEAAGEAAVSHGAQDYLVKGKVDGGLLARAIRYAVGRRYAEEVDQQLRVAEVRADENARLERGLIAHPLVSESSLWIASTYMPGRRRALLGGDFYDAVETIDGHVLAVVGDVSGRGPDEAALGACLRIAWRALALSGAPGDLVVPTLHQMVEHERQVPGAFATLCALDITPDRRELSLRRAGHPAPVLIDGNAITSLPLDRGGPPVGMFAGSQWPEAHYELPEDWSILIYTDGVIEVRDGDTGQVGEDGLVDLIAEHIDRVPDWRQEPQGLLRHIVARLKEINQDEPDDDIAMLLLGAR